MMHCGHPIVSSAGDERRRRLEFYDIAPMRGALYFSFYYFFRCDSRATIADYEIHAPSFVSDTKCVDRREMTMGLFTVGSCRCASSARSDANFALTQISCGAHTASPRQCTRNLHTDIVRKRKKKKTKKISSGRGSPVVQDPRERLNPALLFIMIYLVLYLTRSGAATMVPDPMRHRCRGNIKSRDS